MRQKTAGLPDCASMSRNQAELSSWQPFLSASASHYHAPNTYIYKYILQNNFNSICQYVRFAMYEMVQLKIMKTQLRHNIHAEREDCICFLFSAVPIQTRSGFCLQTKTRCAAVCHMRFQTRGAHSQCMDLFLMHFVNNKLGVSTLCLVHNEHKCLIPVSVRDATY